MSDQIVREWIGKAEQDLEAIHLLQADEECAGRIRSRLRELLTP